MRFSLSKLREFIESANEQLIVRVKPRVEDASVIAFRKSLYWIRDSVNLLYARGDSALTPVHIPTHNLLHSPTMLALRCRNQLLEK